MIEWPFISVVIPCYNEEKFIAAFIENLLAQDYPKDKTEIIFSDGMSKDRTKEIVESYAASYEFIQCIDNPGRYVPSALNLAIAKSRGEIIVRMDAHSVYPPSYWSTLVTKLIFHKADNVGGVWLTHPGANTSIARAIVLATSHRLGIGNAGYRLGAEKDVEVDTVPYGCFRRDLFTRIGYFDEQLIRNQDDEFNGRIRKHGGKIILIPTVKIIYYARESFSKMSSMFYQYGLFKPLVNIKLGAPATTRQFAPPLLVLSFIILPVAGLFHFIFFYMMIVLLAIYVLAVLITAIRLVRSKGFSMIILTAVAFPVIHFSYGIGYIFGVIKFTIFRQHKRVGLQGLKSNR